MSLHDPAWLDVQYDNRARVPTYARIFERWTEASQRTREVLSRRLDVRYGPGPNELVDVFPSPRRLAPVLVFIHGGWWRMLDKNLHSFVAPTFVHAGAMVVVPDYANCPGTPEQPATIESIALQTTRALAWTYRNAAMYGGDPRRIVVVGHSAGAHLAAMMLSCDWRQVGADLPAQLVRSALGISGVYDLDPITRVSFLKNDLRLGTESAARLSPVRYPKPKGTFHAFAGADESEEFLRQTRALREAWGPRAVPVCETIPGANHYDVLHRLVDPDERLQQQVLALLGKR